MPEFEWTADLETGHQHIDDQHRSLFALANALAECSSCSLDETEVVTDAIYRLNDYVIEHFADEEGLMRESGYPHTTQHKALHGHLTTHTMKLMTDYFNGTHVAASRIAPFVTGWFRTHIDVEDRAFVAFLSRPSRAAD